MEAEATPLLLLFLQASTGMAVLASLGNIPILWCDFGVLLEVLSLKGFFRPLSKFLRLFIMSSRAFPPWIVFSTIKVWVIPGDSKILEYCWEDW